MAGELELRELPGPKMTEQVRAELRQELEAGTAGDRAAQAMGKAERGLARQLALAESRPAQPAALPSPGWLRV
jgi:hypothetical protein